MNYTPKLLCPPTPMITANINYVTSQVTKVTVIKHIHITAPGTIQFSAGTSISSGSYSNAMFSFFMNSAVGQVWDWYSPGLVLPSGSTIYYFVGQCNTGYSAVITIEGEIGAA